MNPLELVAKRRAFKASSAQILHKIFLSFMYFRVCRFNVVCSTPVTFQRKPRKNVAHYILTCSMLRFLFNNVNSRMCERFVNCGAVLTPRQRRVPAEVSGSGTFALPCGLAVLSSHKTLASTEVLGRPRTWTSIRHPVADEAYKQSCHKRQKATPRKVSTKPQNTPAAYKSPVILTFSFR